MEGYLTDIEVAEPRNPVHCEGYPECDECDSTRKVRFGGEPLLDHPRRTIAEPAEVDDEGCDHPTRWLGWRGQVTPEEARRNRDERPEDDR